MSLALRSLPICAAAVLAVGGAAAQTTPPGQPRVQTLRDGRHDFDWEFGTWRTKVRVLRNPLSGEKPDWAEYQGTSVVRPLLAGRSNLVELSVEGPAGRIEGVSLRLYGPQTHLWSLNYANARNGLLTVPVAGAFDGRGRGVFYADDTLDGRPIKVRFIITIASHKLARFEQSYSADEGATWEANWVAEDTLLRPPHKD
jgi:hypothetical protein